MASIGTSVEIARSPEDVFAYITDVSRHPEWQEGLVSATLESEGPVRVGSRVVHRRKLGLTTGRSYVGDHSLQPSGSRGLQGSRRPDPY